MIQLTSNNFLSPVVNVPDLDLPLQIGESIEDAFKRMQCEMNAYHATVLAGGWIEDRIAASLPGRVASYVWSKLPTFSLPGAYGSTVCDKSSVCEIPEGTYQETCYRLKADYLPEKGKCKLTGRCETLSKNLSLKNTSVEFTPGDAPSIVNRNGFLVDVSAPDTVEDAFERIATETGGDVTPWPSSEDLTPVMGKVFEKILKDSETSDSLDVAFVLDTTSSMGPYIEEVRLNLVKFLEQLQGKKDTRVAILEYRDSDDSTIGSTGGFLNKVNTPFTKDLKEVQKAVQGLTVSGGGDVPEAVLDALLAAKDKLSWNPNAKRMVLLVGDAPPHPKTKDGRYDESDVLAQYTAIDTDIAVYPVLAMK